MTPDYRARVWKRGRWLARRPHIQQGAIRIERNDFRTHAEAIEWATAKQPVRLSSVDVTLGDLLQPAAATMSQIADASRPIAAAINAASRRTRADFTLAGPS